MQKILRILIIIAILITAYLLILAWRNDYIVNAPKTQSVVTASEKNDVPTASHGDEIGRTNHCQSRQYSCG